MNKGNNFKKKTVSAERAKEIKEVKAKEKKIVKRIIVIVAVISVIVLVWKYFFDRPEDKSEYEFVVRQIDEVYPTLNPYPADFDKDLSSYKPDIMYKYKDRGLTESIADVPEEAKTEGQRFFEKYFDIIINGKYEEYGSLFSKSYKKTPNGFEKNFDRAFPPQQVFDILVEELTPQTIDTSVKYTYEGKPCSFSYYMVSYSIEKNDGYFRRDLYKREVKRPLVFELVTFNKGTDSEVSYIINMYTESSIQKPE